MASDNIVGIDLGTTNSLVAYMQGDSPAVIPGEDGVNLVPSVVALDDKNQIIIGNAARKYLIETPERAVYSVKRLMGRGVEDIQEELKLFPFRLADDLQPGEVLRIKIGERTYTPPEISALILRQLLRRQPLGRRGPIVVPRIARRRWQRRHVAVEAAHVGGRHLAGAEALQPQLRRNLLDARVQPRLNAIARLFGLPFREQQPVNVHDVLLELFRAHGGVFIQIAECRLIHISPP